MKLANQLRPRIDDGHFDVAILGGGINGVAIARECARAGRRTLLVEQNDFASGTTSRSTRIIHGGLRYLEHGEIGLVRESVRERQRLLSEHPHLVRPKQFVLALPRGRRSALEIRFGLWLYRKYAGTRRNRAAPDAAAALDELLDASRTSLRLFAYEDAQCEFPERLVAEWLWEALACGAVVRNHARALAIETANGKVRGLRLRDQVSGDEYRVTATVVLNATGPWADAVCRDSAIETHGPMIGGVRGSHIVLPRFPGAPTAAIYTEATDGRPVFLVPWNGQILFGTTEVRDSGDPGQVRPEQSEIEYLIESLRRLCPNVSLPQFSYAFAGVRPLPFTPGADENAVTRRHFLRDHKEDGAAGLISVIGGKLTTAASLARECARKIGIAIQEPKLTALADAQSAETALVQFTREIEISGGLSAESAAALVAWHGRQATEIARLAAEDDRLRQPLTDGAPHVVAEAVFAVANEAAATLADVLLRRVPVALSAGWSDEQSREAAQRMGAVLDWNEARIATELENFASERSAFLVQPAVAGRTAV